MLKSMSLRATIAAILAGLSLSAHAIADSARPINVPAGELVVALETLSRQADVDLVFQPEQLKSFRTEGVSGTYSPQDAIRILLKGTPLQLRTDASSGAMVIAPPTGRRTSSSLTDAPSSPSRESSDAQNKSFWSRLRLAHFDASSPSQGEGRGEGTTAGDQSAAQSQKKLELEEIVVVGSRLGASESQSPQPIKILNREYIERSGLTSVSEVISTLPEVSLIASEMETVGGAGTVRLRGLPLGSTLVLLNGRNLGSSGAQAAFGGFFDLNNIPLAAVERIEVLPSGASAIYGGEAMAGVINIVLRKRYEGVGATVSYGAAEGTDEKQATLSWGAQGDALSISLLGTYFTRNELLGGEREMTANQDYRRYGGTDRRRDNANPGNVFSTSGNLPGLSSPFAAIPASATGNLSISDFQATSGTLNRSSSGAASRALLPESERYSLLLQGKYAFAAASEVFSEVLYSKTDQTTFATPFAITRARVPASNPFNPFGQDVLVSYEFTDTPGSSFETEYVRPLLGARGPIGNEWIWEVAAWVTDEYTHQNLALFNSAAVTAALVATDPSQALNPFATGSAEATRFATLTVQEFTSESSNVDAFLRGRLIEGSRFEVQALLGAEGSKSTFDRVGTAPVTGDRDVYAFFSEARIPIRTMREGMLQDVLTVSAAVRYDHYSDFGTAVTPQVGLNWYPLRGVTFSSSYGETFKPPTLFHLFQPLSLSQAQIRDPRRGNENVTVQLVRGGNAELDPSTGESWSVGVAYSPPDSQLIDVSLTHWSVELTDSVGGGGPQLYVDNEASLPGRNARAQPTPEDVAAGRPGRLLSIDGTWLNVGSLELSGVDASISSSVRTSIGTWSPSLAATHVYHYEGTLAPFAPATNRVGIWDESGYAPRWKGSTSLAWERQAWSASLVGRYTGRYTFEGNPVGDFWYLDAHLSCDLGVLFEPLRGGLSRLRVSVGVVNALDEAPDFAGGTFGYDRSQYDIRGRFWYTRLMADW